MELKQALAQNLKSIRKTRKESLMDFSREIGISKSTLQNIERGKGTTLDTVECISRNLGIGTDVLLSCNLARGQLGIIVQLLQETNWFADLSTEDQSEYIAHLDQMTKLLAKIKHTKEKKHDSRKTADDPGRDAQL